MVEGKRYFIRILRPLYVVAAYVFLYLPMFVMVLFSFNNDKISMEWKGFTWRWYKHFFSSPEILDALYTSLIVAFFSMLVSVVVGTCYVFAGRWFKQSVFSNLFYLNVILPDIILAVGVLSIFTFLHIPLGYASLIVGHSLIGLGFVIPIVKARFEELDPELTEASLDLGAGHAQTFIRVILPLLFPALIASGLLVFTLSLDDFLIAFFCSSPNVQTLSVYVYSMIKTCIDPSINAVSTCLLLVSSIMVLLLSAFKVIDRVIGHD